MNAKCYSLTNCHGQTLMVAIWWMSWSTFGPTGYRTETTLCLFVACGSATSWMKEKMEDNICRSDDIMIREAFPHNLFLPLSISLSIWYAFFHSCNPQITSTAIYSDDLGIDSNIKYGIKNRQNNAKMNGNGTKNSER